MINKFTLFTLMGAIAGGAFSAGAVTPMPALQSPKSALKLSDVKISQNPEPGRLPSRLTPQLTDVITEVEGREQYFLKESSGYFPYAGAVYEYHQYKTPSFIIYGEDNDIYFLDLMEFGYDTYIKGTIDGNKITVPLPQTEFTETFLWYDDGPSTFYYNLCVMKQVGEGSDLNYVPVDEITEVTYTIGEDGTITLEPFEEGYGLGLMSYIYDFTDEEMTEKTWYGAWSGAIDFTQVFRPSDIEVIKIPKDAETETWYCIYDDYNYPVTVAFIDDYMYIQGFYDSPYMSNLTVKATIDGDRAFIPQMQHIGVFRLDNDMMVTRCGRLKGYNLVYEDESINFEMTVDKENHKISVADPSQYLVIAYESDNATLAYMNNFSYTWQESYNGTPSNPFGLFWNDRFLADYDYYSFGFEIKPFTAEGDVLLTGDLYYQIFMDGELQEFVHEYDPDYMRYGHYYMVDEPTILIPFMFTNDNDIDIWTPTERQIGIYVDGVSTMGVQAVYKYNGNVTYSDIVTLDLETGEVTAGVGSAQAGVSPVSTQWYDLNGRRVENPQDGIFIGKITMSDGSVKTVKVAR